MDAKSERQRAEYVGRVNRVVDYIENHLDETLTLEGLAGVANFSKFHFHRIFSSVVGETLNSFIQRVRTERAATLLLADLSTPVTDIALDCGFSSSATFARMFKEWFGMSATEWRAGGFSTHRKNGKAERNYGQTVGNICEAVSIEQRHIGDATHHPKWRIEMKREHSEKTLTADVEVKEMPALNVAYVRHVGPYAGDAGLFERLFAKLMAWAGPRDLLRFPETKGLCVYHDDPNITEEEKLRVSACITVPEGTKVEGDIGQMVVPGGKFAVARFEIDATQFGDAWAALMSGWMPGSGYQPDDRLAYEMGQNDPKSHPEGKHIVDICMPVKPL